MQSIASPAPGVHNFAPIDRVLFNQDAAEAVRAEAQRWDCQRVLLMVSTSLNRQTDEIRRIEAALGPRHAETLDGVPQHTTRTAISKATRAALAARADLIVAVGGGSVIDAAKMTLLCMERGMTDDHLQGLDPLEVKRDEKGALVRPVYPGPSVRMIAVPSTLNGGEFNGGCLVTDERHHHKQTFYHPLLMPRAIVLSPALTVHTPEALWLGSATRAMDHAIEALLSVNATPLADAVVLDGIGRMVEALRRWREAPSDLARRADCQLASWLCSFGLSSHGGGGRLMMGPSHAIGHVLGGTCNVPHYFCTPVLMSAILRWSEPATSAKQQRLAVALGHPELPAHKAFAQLVQELKLPGNLGAVGVDASQFQTIADIAMREIFIHGSAMSIQGKADVIKILELAC